MQNPMAIRVASAYPESPVNGVDCLPIGEKPH